MAKKGRKSVSKRAVAIHKRGLSIRVKVIGILIAFGILYAAFDSFFGGLSTSERNRYTIYNYYLSEIMQHPESWVVFHYPQNEQVFVQFLSDGKDLGIDVPQVYLNSVQEEEVKALLPGYQIVRYGEQNEFYTYVKTLEGVEEGTLLAERLFREVYGLPETFDLQVTTSYGSEYGNLYNNTAYNATG